MGGERRPPRGQVPLNAEDPGRDVPVRRRLLLLLPLGFFLFALLPDKASTDDNLLLDVPGGRINVTIGNGARGLSSNDIGTWITSAARAVAGVYGEFPVSQLRLFVRLSMGRGVNGGRTTPGQPPRIQVSVGRSAGGNDLADDWVMVHEMIHLGFPSVSGPHHWMEEGLATYVEPVARTRVGLMSVDRFWYETVRDMPQGLPAADDAGLNHNRGWAATYWGGALFWFVADVQIRQETGGRKSLDDVLRAIHREGASINQEWPVSEVIAVGDRATGVDVLRRMYDGWGVNRGTIDLKSLFKRLGVSRRGGTVIYDDTASLAGLRKAITARKRY